MAEITLLGASGFVGSAVAEHARASGHTVATVSTPRLSTTSRNLEGLQHDLPRAIAQVRAALAPMRGSDVLINAAGVAHPTSSITNELYGANALLPAALSAALDQVHINRLVHISSAAVHGTSPLDEGSEVAPETPYAFSKALGETAVHRYGEGEYAIYRPTSVHGLNRPLTRRLILFARSRLASVAGRGDSPTPQVLVSNVAAIATHLAVASDVPPQPVLHPWEGLTTESLLIGLGGGKLPRHVPPTIARSAVRTSRFAGAANPKLYATARRLEMLWFGQEQSNGWLQMNMDIELAPWDDFFQCIRSTDRLN
ncbi:NAD-dependent epimerase/dehydratase family protein [Georgenia muralis]